MTETVWKQQKMLKAYLFWSVDDKCERRLGKAEKKLGPCTAHFWLGQVGSGWSRLDVLHGCIVSREWPGDLRECHKLRELFQLY